MFNKRYMIMKNIMGFIVCLWVALGIVSAQAETLQEEAARRATPVLYSLTLPDKILSGQSYTVSWSVLGYHSGYQSQVAFFNCAGIATDCGADYANNTENSGDLDPTSTETGAWDYNGILSTRFHYTYSFTAPTVSGDTDLVMRFYRINDADNTAGKSRLALLVPGGLSNVAYYDSTGRRIKKTVLDDSAFPGSGFPKVSTLAAQRTDANTTTSSISFSVDDLESDASGLSVAVSSSNTALVPTTNIFVGGSGTTRTITATPSSNEAGETTITIALSDGTNTTIGSFVLTVGSALSIADVTIEEGDSGSVNLDFVVSLDQASTQTITVDYATSDGTATGGVDYTTTSGTLTFSPGDTSKTISVPIVGETMDESDETFTVTLNNPVSASISDATATGTITDNDPEPTVNFSSADQTQFEGSLVTVTVQLSEASTFDVTVPFSISGGTATTADYSDVSASPVTIVAGGTSTDITFRTNWDADSDDGETVIFTLDTPTYATVGTTDTHTVTIANRDITPIVPKTGQTTSYATGDDGDVQPGVAWPDPRFTDNGDGTILDNLTGLIWLQNANCFGGQTWDNALASANTLANGSCSLTDGSVAEDWRLPNRKELRSLIDYQQYSPALPSGHPFTGVQANGYWSSTAYASSTCNAWDVNLNLGGVNCYGKTGNYYVWPVRGGQ